MNSFTIDSVFYISRIWRYANTTPNNTHLHSEINTHANTVQCISKFQKPQKQMRRITEAGTGSRHLRGIAAQSHPQNQFWDPLFPKIHPLWTVMTSNNRPSFSLLPPPKIGDLSQTMLTWFGPSLWSQSNERHEVLLFVLLLLLF